MRVDGHDVRDVQRRSLTRRMGVVLQDPFLFSGSVAENIRYGNLDATDADIRRAAQIVGADDWIRRLSDGYDTVLAEPRPAPLAGAAATGGLRARRRLRPRAS